MSVEHEVPVATRAPDQAYWRALYAGVTLLVAAAVLFQVYRVLSPVLLFIALVVLLRPYATHRFHLRLILGLGFLLLVFLFRTLGSLLAPFILSLVLAYILDPLVDWIERKGVGRGTAIALISLPILASIALFVIFGIPTLAQQAANLLEQVPAALNQLAQSFETLRARARETPMIGGEMVDRVLSSFTPERITAYIETQRAEIARRVWGGLVGFGRGIGILLSVLSYLVLVPILVVYFLKDFTRLTTKVVDLMPPQKRQQWIPLLREYDGLLSRYLRGQLTAAATVGVLTWLGLWGAQFPYAGLVGAVAGVFNVVPYLGLAVSLVPAVIISILSGSFGVAMLKVAIVFTVVQLLDSAVIGPRIIGGSVGLHPIWVMLALALGGFYFGFVGLLIAMPGAVLVKLLLREALKQYRMSRFYRGVDQRSSER